MPKSIAEERTRVVALAIRPVNPLRPTEDELAAAVDLSCKLLASDFRLSPTASDTVDEPALCEGSNSPVPGKGNYEGNFTPFRYLDDDGKPVVLEDVAWELLRRTATELHVYKRTGPRFDVPFAAGDSGVEYYHIITDTPQDPTELSGYVKKVVPLFVQGDSNVTDVEVVAA